MFPRGRVHNLGPDNFHKFVASAPTAVISFNILDDRLKRQQRFATEFQHVADIMQDAGISFGQVDAFVHGASDFWGEFEIPTWSIPQVRVFRGLGRWKMYHGFLEHSCIVSWLNRYQTFPTLSNLDAQTLPQFKKSSDRAVIAYLEANDDKTKDAVRSVAETMHPEFVFGITGDLALAEANDVKAPGMVVYDPSAPGFRVVPITHSVDQMVRKIRQATRPLIDNYATEMHEQYLQMGLALGYVFTDSPAQKASTYEAIRSLAGQFHDRLQFLSADLLLHDSLFEDLRLNNSRSPAFAIRDSATFLRYPMDESSDSFAEDLRGFVEAYFRDELKPSIKSEPVPPDSDDKVTKVVGLTFRDIVLDEDKDVFLAYNITPCAPCARLMLTLEALAAPYAIHPTLSNKVTIATVDYDLNDTAEEAIYAFPTLKLFPAGSKASPLLYDGDMTLDSMADFIREKGTHGATL